MDMGAPEPGSGSRPPSGMLLDDSAVPAPFALTQAQELPPFGTDDDERPLAMAEDRQERPRGGRAANTPVPIVEKPG